MLRYIETLDNTLHQRILDKKRELESAGKLTDENLDKIERLIEIEFVYNTNSIEGNTLTRGETQRVLRGLTISGRPLTDVQEVKNHPEAIQLIKELSFSKQRKITEKDILELHRLAMTGVIMSAGKYRQSDDFYVPGAGFLPSPFYEISSEIKELMEFINENIDELTPIEIAAHSHYFFARIHAFENGNGRIARLLTNFILLRNHYPFIVFKKVERKQYLATLRKADNGDFKPFLVYVARLVEQTLDTYLFGMKEGTERPQLLTLSELAKGTPYSAKYLGLLAGRGIIDTTKEGKIWKTTKKTIDSYIEQHGRKPTPLSVK